MQQKQIDTISLEVSDSIISSIELNCNTKQLVLNTENEDNFETLYAQLESQLLDATEGRSPIEYELQAQSPSQFILTSSIKKLTALLKYLEEESTYITFLKQGTIEKIQLTLTNSSQSKHQNTLFTTTTKSKEISTIQAQTDSKLKPKSKK